MSFFQSAANLSDIISGERSVTIKNKWYIKAYCNPLHSPVQREGVVGRAVLPCTYTSAGGAGEDQGSFIAKKTISPIFYLTFSGRSAPSTLNSNVLRSAYSTHTHSTRFVRKLEHML